VKRDAQAVILLLVGGTLIKISLTGTYLRYVKHGLQPLLLISGGVLVLVAAVTLWQSVRAGSRATGAPHGRHAAHHDHDHDHDTPRTGEHEPAGAVDLDDDGHGHAHAQPRIAWLLLAPTLALLMFAPPPIGAFQADRSGTALSAQAPSDYAPLPEGDPVRLSILDYASRAVFDHGQSIGARQVVMSGFIMAGPNGAPYLARMVLTCCAADARPIKIGLMGDVPGGLAPDTWLEVVGTYTDRQDKDPVNGEAIPYLQVTSSKTITAPANQYES
jgi:uncharacterized repeat protein (TIGR03943 family)